MNKMSKFRLCGEANTTITGKLLYLMLNEVANRSGEVIIPQRKISGALHISKGTVSRNLRHLRDSGYIDIIAQYNDYGGRAPNKYRLRGK